MYAAIDLGTNTFHMIIVDIHNGKAKVVYRKRHFVKLAYESFEKIGHEAMKRGLDAILNFKYSMERYGVKEYLAYGTSIFRIAKNGNAFIEFLKAKSGLNISIISGNDEARLIFQGAKMANALDKGNNLIIDIGGGSVEFILTDGDKMLFESSYQIGILKLFHQFDNAERQSEESLKEIEQYLYDNTGDLHKQLDGVEISSLVGTAGSFDVLKGSVKTENKSNNFEMRTEKFDEIFESIALTNDKERARMKWIPRERKKLIVFAFAIIDFAIKISRSKILRVTSYSMKEGMIWEMLNNNKT